MSTAEDETVGTTSDEATTTTPVAAAAADSGAGAAAGSDAKVAEVEGPHAVQIVNVSDDGNHFVLNEDKLKGVLSNVPHNLKVAVVSVVGAFRTGKSFVLDILLRYLQYCEDHPSYDFASDDAAPGESTWLYSSDTIGGTGDEPGFKWRSGHDRMTTGIWMWSKYFKIKRPGTGEDIAVLILDSQGLYDYDTSEQLTTSIFGLSTLISSHLVFNVHGRVQEDNLKSLALFAEYARVALHANRDAGGSTAATTDLDADAKTEEDKAASTAPFQTVEFLVRDASLRARTMPEKLDEMQRQMTKIMSANANSDITTTRSQVLACFQSVKGFFLPYPGEDVADSPVYDGTVSSISAKFRVMVEEYVRQLFCDTLDVKVIHGREVSATELFYFFAAYSKSFAESTIFPKAESLLIATATANNRAFADRAMEAYTEAMDKIAGVKAKYMPVKKLKERHNAIATEALKVYEDGATFGPAELVQEQRTKLEASIDKSFIRYEETNKTKDPFTNTEVYIVALVVAVIAYVLRVVSDTTCGGISDVCDSASNFLSMIYVMLFALILLSFATSFHTSISRLRTLIEVFGVPLMAKATGAKVKQE